MKQTSRACLLGCALLLGADAQPQVARAQTQPTANGYDVTAKSYVVTMSIESAAGNIVAREGLSLERAGHAAFLALAAGDGSVLTRPVTFTPRGEIATSSQDGAVTCYNMAMNALARRHDPAADPAAVFVRFGSSVVRIPLNTTSVQTHGDISEIALDGRSSGVYASADESVDAGIIINATVAEAAGELNGATFEELHYLGTPAHVVMRSTCVLQRATGRPGARV